MLVGQLQVVLLGNRLRVADPFADHVPGELLGQFGLPRAAKILEQLGPRFQAGPADDLREAGSQVLRRVASDRDDVLGRLVAKLVPKGIEVGPQLREDRHHARLTTFVVLGLGAADGHPLAFPIDVIPSQG
ncbi:MAG: hypothetical protein K1X74_09210 [Pirellulales bacterium]|nr:hypothetical protein [Pirellulales bacterium]